ncbi:DUF4876 domain-containing protein [Rapidithrix thailandica]|uniref:DUF4876 domain-containing protein n=1 Tax=Rapidithrix thailandica TaxID=413964 RepID=A0AAW9RN98_9BACT
MNFLKVNCLAIFMGLFLFTACNENDDGVPPIEPVSYQVQLGFKASLSEIVPMGIEVRLRNLNSDLEYTGTTDETGLAEFAAIVPGSYEVKANLQLTQSEFKELFGFTTQNELTNFNAVHTGVVINHNQAAKIELTLESARIGGLVFKQIYYVGSDRNKAAMFRDMFFEIYNNSDEEIYLDGICFAQLFGSTSTKGDSKQFDWSQSIGQTKGDRSNTGYVYADHVYKIPGSGTDYPLAPGASVVIAGTGINHKAPLVVDGKEYKVEDPSLTVDLSDAAFEINLRQYRIDRGMKPYSTDIDNPDVPNMDIVYNLSNKDLILDVMGRDSFILFRLTEDASNWDRLPNPEETVVDEDTKRYLQIPVEIIVDGVEINRPVKPFPRRLPQAIDGGYTYAPKGIFSSQSLIRRVATTLDGRKILQDTNNSSEDFITIDLPLPGGWVE